MNTRFWKKTAAGLLALLIVSGGMPLQPISKTFEEFAVTANAKFICCFLVKSNFDSTGFKVKISPH